MTKKMPFSSPVVGIPNLTIGSFWQWAYSDILSNRNRSIFAEYLVGTALGVVSDSVREEWAGFDLEYCGKKIEVKSSAYLQAWEHNAPSKPRFDIARKRAWDSKLNTYTETEDRYADYYVFCLFTTQSIKLANVLDANQWLFFLISVENITQHFGNQKSVSLSAIENVAQLSTYSLMKENLDQLVDRA